MPDPQQPAGSWPDEPDDDHDRSYRLVAIGLALVVLALAGVSIAVVVLAS